MKSGNKLISVESALAAVLNGLRPAGTEEVKLAGAPERVLAENIKSVVPNPAWDNSAVDGYALRAEDTAGAGKARPVELKVIYKLPAGSLPGKTVGMGEAVRIMTGAPIPDGADAAIKLEETEEMDGYVLIRSRAGFGQHVRKKGCDFGRGMSILKRGTLIGPAEIAMLALAGLRKAAVYKKLKVAILATGNELCKKNEKPSFGKIPDCNTLALAAAVKECGGQPITLGPAKDNRNTIREAIEKGLKAADCVVTSGGVSAGDYDFVGDVMGELGGDPVSWKVAMKPGKPFAFARINSKPVFGLPGNTVSALMSFETFVRPSILKMSGRNEIFREYLYAELTGDITRNPERRSFLRSVLRREGPRLVVRLLPKQGSGMLKSLIDSNSMTIVPEGAGLVRKNSKVKVVPFGKFLLRADPDG